MEDPSAYCRALETYLCQKNEGHLIRIVGPTFEQVCGWAAQGVPLAIAYRGIDRYCERYYAKQGRRRPVRIEFCEADILELFDDWRRAVGIRSAAEQDLAARHRRDSLPSHLERLIARLTALRAGGRRSASFDQHIDEIVRELDGHLSRSKTARGEERTLLITHIEQLDSRLVEAALQEIPEARQAALHREAQAELEPFAPRMAPDARERALAVAFERLVRAELGLPVLAFA